MSARITQLGSRGKLKAEFDTVNDVFRIIDKLGWVPQHSESSNSRGEGGNFHTFKSLAEARDTFENHPERVRLFSANDSKLVNRDSPGKDVEYDVTGDYIDIDRYLEGVPEVMGNAVLGNPKSLFCTINILGSFVHWTKPEYVLAKQKRVLRLVDWLESQGIRAQISITDDSEVAYISTTVKEFGDPFDLNHLAVATHPDWLRRIEFLIMEQSKTWEWGYGSGVEYDKRMTKYKPNPEDGLYVYVGGYIPTSIEEMEADFDKIEDSIEQIIKDGLTFNEEPLVVRSAKSGW